MRQPKLRDSHNLITELYPIGNVPTDIITKIGASLVYMIYTGRKDITGDDWGDIFSKAVNGEHYAKPVGIVDVAQDKMAWSMKTVKVPHPFSAPNVRLISGRCSPDYSFGIEDPHDDIQKTGEAVLAIWNARVDIALSHFPRVRVSVLIRNNKLDEYTLFEEYLEHFNIADYEWRENCHNVLEGFHRVTGLKTFSWQPHGAQFTIITSVPENKIKFRLRKPKLQPQELVLKQLGFDQAWIEFVE